MSYELERSDSMEDDYQTWLWGKTAERCVKNLKKNGFDAHFVENVAEAKDLDS